MDRRGECEKIGVAKGLREIAKDCERGVLNNLIDAK